LTADAAGLKTPEGRLPPGTINAGFSRWRPTVMKRSRTACRIGDQPPDRRSLDKDLVVRADPAKSGLHQRASVHRRGIPTCGLLHDTTTVWPTLNRWAGMAVIWDGTAPKIMRPPATLQSP